MTKTTKKSKPQPTVETPTNVTVAGTLRDIADHSAAFAAVTPGRHTITFTDAHGTATLSVYWDGVTLTV